MNKMTMRNYGLYALLGILLFAVACSDDDVVTPEPEPEAPTDTVTEVRLPYQDAIFVLNEGNFNGNNASLSVIDSLNKVTNYVYSDNNGNAELGEILQSGVIVDSLLVLSVNNSNKLVTLNMNNSLETVYTVTDVKLPRYLVASKGFVYVSEWVNWAIGRISKVDVISGEVVDTVQVGYSPDELLYDNGKIYVANSGSGSISIIDESSFEVTATIAVGSSPGAMALDADGDLWVICAGGYEANDGALYEVDLADNSVKTKLEFGANVYGNLVASPTTSVLYYNIGLNVFELAADASALPSTALFSASDAVGVYGMSISPEGLIYIADAKDYISTGSVFVYDVTGSLQDSYTVGLLPNGFVFN